MLVCPCSPLCLCVWVRVVFLTCRVVSKDTRVSGVRAAVVTEREGWEGFGVWSGRQRFSLSISPCRREETCCLWWKWRQHLELLEGECPGSISVLDAHIQKEVGSLESWPVKGTIDFALSVLWAILVAIFCFFPQNHLKLWRSGWQMHRYIYIKMTQLHL